MLHHHFHFLTRLLRHGSDFFPVPTQRSARCWSDARPSRVATIAGQKTCAADGFASSPLSHLRKTPVRRSSGRWSRPSARHFTNTMVPAAGTVLSSDDIANYIKRTRDARVLCSHQAMLPPPKIRGREVVTSILIRDPIPRIRSIYAFEQRQEARSPGALKAKELDFKGYVEWRLETSPSMLCNFQVHFCARTKRSSRKDLGSEALLRKAIANLDQVDLVGTVARYNEWLALVQVVLSQRFPDILLVVTRPKTSPISPARHKQKKTFSSDWCAILDRPWPIILCARMSSTCRCTRLQMHC